MILKIENLNVYYGGSHIIQDLSMDFDRGSVAVIGKNGMGKTTLAKAIIGIAPVNSGTIFFDGVDITNMQPYKISRLGIGYVPQGRKVYKSLTVDEHLRFAATEVANGWDAEKVYELFPRLAERKNQYGTSLSGGEQQMLAIGRALVTNPKLIIMDEPSEGLAPLIVDQLIEFCKFLNTTDTSILLIEQNLNFAKQVTDDVHVMLTGQFALSAKMSEFLADKKLSNQLMGLG